MKEKLIQDLEATAEGHELGPEWRAIEMIATFMKATNIALGDLSDAVARLETRIENNE